MNKSETADLLGFCAGFDKRTIGPADVNAWALALFSVDEDDAREGVVVFYRESHTDDRGRDRPVMPGDILKYLRLRDAKNPPPQLPRPDPPDALVALQGRLRVEAAAAAGKADNKARRARVLADPDLAARLTRPPLNYPRASMWNGFVPPRLDPAVPADLLHTPGIHGPGRPNQRNRRAKASGTNESDRRRALVEISMEALARDNDDDDW